MIQIEWYWLLLIIILVFLFGYIVSYFMIRNNPKYLNVDKMIKDEIEKRREEVIKSVQAKVSELK